MKASFIVSRQFSPSPRPLAYALAATNSAPLLVAHVCARQSRPAFCQSSHAEPGFASYMLRIIVFSMLSREIARDYAARKRRRFSQSLGPEPKVLREVLQRELRVVIQRDGLPRRAPILTL